MPRWDMRRGAILLLTPLRSSASRLANVDRVRNQLAQAALDRDAVTEARHDDVNLLLRDGLHAAGFDVRPARELRAAQPVKRLRIRIDDARGDADFATACAQTSYSRLNTRINTTNSVQSGWHSVPL